MKQHSTNQFATARRSPSLAMVFKQRRVGESGFFNLRVSIGLLTITTGLSLALFVATPFGRGAAAPTAGTGKAQQKYNPAGHSIDFSMLPPGFDCSKIHEKGIDKQDNMRAGMIMIACGLSEGGSAPDGGTSGSSTFSKLINSLLPAPLFIGGGDVDVILPDAAFPKVTQSESMEWGGPNNTWVVNYNDSRTSGGCYAGLSYSTDNGATWHASQPLCSGHGTNFGDPIVVYNARLGMWFAGDLATGCGGQGIGLWTSPDGITWTVGACAHNSGNDDRESMWVDNNSSSTYFGRMYVSVNDYARGQRIYVAYSDDGTTWSTPVQVSDTFYRNIQLTGSPDDGTVFVAAMDEGTGGVDMRQNIIYRSTDGGAN